MSLRIETADIWNNPGKTATVEESRYPFQRALRKIVAGTLTQHVDPGSRIVEIGAGQGYLKTLVPPDYHDTYFTSDYSLANLSSGRIRRPLQAFAASAFHLPLRPNSTDCILNLDAYDTLPDLQVAMAEVATTLRPGGTFIHFQAHLPSDDTVMFDYPDYVFLPALTEESRRKANMVGMKREDLIKGLDNIKTRPYKGMLESLLIDQMGFWKIIFADKENGEMMIDLLHSILDAIPGNQIIIPSLHEYLKNKLERTAESAELAIVTSGYKSTTVRGQRIGIQNQYPQYNQFSYENGVANIFPNPELHESQAEDVIEKASILVFVARKPLASTE